MRRTLISRPNVERVMRMVDLDVKTSNAKDHEKLVDELIDKIKILGTERDDIYTITYNNPEPETGQGRGAVAADHLRRRQFRRQEAGFRKGRPVHRRPDQELRRKAGGGRKRHEGLQDPQHGHAAAQGSDYSGKMIELSDQLNQARLELLEAEQARNAIKRQIAGDDPAPVTAPTRADAADANPELDGRIQAAEQAARHAAPAIHRSSIRTSSPRKRLLAQLEAQEEGRSRRSTSAATIRAPTTARCCSR